MAMLAICQLLLTAETDILSSLAESPTFKEEKSSLVFPNQYYLNYIKQVTPPA